MAESPLSLAAAPSAPAIVPPPQLSQATVPPPLLSQPNASSDPPTLFSPTPPASPPLSAPPPSVPALPPAVPASPPPTLPPLPSASPPPPDSTNAPPPVVSSPPLSPTLPPPPTPSPSPPSQLLSPPPSSPQPPPPVTISPPPPDSAQSPPPPDSAQSPPPAPLPSSPSQPPPSAQTPPLPSPSPSSSTPAPPSDPSTPPPKNAAPTAPSPSSPDQSAPPPKNAAPAAPSPPSPPPSNVDIPPPQVIQSPAPPSVDPNKPPDSSQNATAGPPDSTFHRGSGIKTGAVVPIVLVAGLFMLSLLGFAVWYTRKRRRSVGRYNAGFVMPSPYASSQYSETSYSRSPTAPLVYNNSSDAVSHGFMNSPGMGNSKSCFTYAELHKITDGFSSKNLLGEGGFGCVYKGCFADGREVAVKQLKVGGGQGEREFAAEVEIISRVHHRHLVSLVGYCIADKQRLLVYDFVCNDTLDYHLHAQGGTVLSWAMRVKIAAGAARGIAYLHEDCHPRIIHRDIKSSNILLDSNFEAQVSDFGLARLAMDAETHITTRVMGTFGYLAPEYASSGKLTDRSDVYSFGVVLLELITGRKPVDQTQPIGEESLVEWARPLMTQALDSGDFGELPDARLENNYNENEMFRMIEAAAACVRHSAAMRPKMGLVVRALDTLTDTDINNGVIPGQSELFAAPQSAEIRMFQRMAFGSQNFSDGFTRSSWMSRTESETTSDVP